MNERRQQQHAHKKKPLSPSIIMSGNEVWLSKMKYHGRQSGSADWQHADGIHIKHFCSLLRRNVRSGVRGARETGPEWQALSANCAVLRLAVAVVMETGSSTTKSHINDNDEQKHSNGLIQFYYIYIMSSLWQIFSMPRHGHGALQSYVNMIHITF